MRSTPTEMLHVPEIRYARAGDIAIAYQTFGEHERNLVLVPMLSNIVFPWWNAELARDVRALCGRSPG